MAVDGDRELVALIQQEQRGFRFILFTGLGLLLVLLVMSGALGYYYYTVSRQLADTARELQREAFTSRRDMDAQRNTVIDQGQRLRRLSQDLRRQENAAPVSVDRALAAASGLLHHGRLSLNDERALDFANDSAIGSPAQRALLAGAYTLMNWERLGDSIAQGSTQLPGRLTRALESFDEARADPALAAAAAAGRAWVLYINAASPLSNYSAEDCDALIAAVAQSAVNGQLGAQPLWWQAQCERKRGRAADALRDYALALERSYQTAQQTGGAGGQGAEMRNLRAELVVAMNAYHGVGTTLIALYGTPETDSAKATALGVARRACVTQETLRARSPEMQLAEACLRIAMDLRRRLGQTPNQISGSGENLSFVYLRDGDYEAAYEHARAVERTGIFAWNELVRALAAARVEGADAVARQTLRRAQQAAERNVSFFRIGQFNLCEIQALMNEDLYQEAVALIRRTREDGGDEANAPVGCQAAAS